MLAVICWPVSLVKSASEFRITIAARGEKNPEARNMEIWLALPAGMDAKKLLATSDPPDTWGLRDNKVWTAQKASLRWDGALPADTVLRFDRHGWCGRVDVEINGKKESFDLYAAEAQPPLEIRLSDYATQRVKGINPTFFALIGLWTAVIFAAFTALAYLAPRRKTPSQVGPLDALLYGAPAAIISLVMLASTWPGGMSPDSVDQWSQLDPGAKLSNAHPIVHTLIFDGVGRLFGTPGATAVLQILLMAAAVGVLCVEIRRWGVANAFVWAGAILTAAYPSVTLMSVMLWKDVPYAIAIVFATALLLALVRTRGGIAHKLWFLAWLAVTLFLVATLRHNGIAVSISLALLIILVWRKPLGIARSTSVAFSGIIGPILFSFALLPAIGIPGPGPHYGGIVPMHVFGAMESANRITDPVLKQRFYAALPAEDYRAAYDCTSSTPLFWHKHVDYSALSSDLVVPALKLMIANPDVATAHVTCVNSLTWRLSPTEHAAASLVLLDIWRDPSGTGPALPKRSPLVPGEMATKYAAWSTSKPSLFVLFWRPALIFLVVLALASLVVATRGAPKMALLALTPIVLNALSLVPVTGSQDFRYLFATTLVGIPLAVLFAGLSRQSRVVGDQKPAPTEEPAAVPAKEPAVSERVA